MNIRRAGVRVAAVVWAALALSAGSHSAADVDNPATAAEEPHQLMVALSTRLFAALDRERAAIRRDPQRVLPVVDELLAPHFDAEYTARLVLGTHWRGASAEQQRRLCRRALPDSAEDLRRGDRRVDAGPIQDFAVACRSHGAADRCTQRSDPAQRHTRSRGLSPTFNHERLEVFDVLVDGVSYAHSYHDDMDTEVNQKGLDAAIVRLERSAPTALLQRSPQVN